MTNKLAVCVSPNLQNKWRHYLMHWFSACSLLHCFFLHFIVSSLLPLLPYLSYFSPIPPSSLLSHLPLSPVISFHRCNCGNQLYKRGLWWYWSIHRVEQRPNTGVNCGRHHHRRQTGMFKSVDRDHNTQSNVLLQWQSCSLYYSRMLYWTHNSGIWIRRNCCVQWNYC